MKEKYKHLLNLDEQRIILLGGIPGSGKSTLAAEFEKTGYKVFCPDTYRAKFSMKKSGRENWTQAMHESDQSVSADAWGLAQKDALAALKNGDSIVFDAMFQTQKARRKIFAQLDKAKVPYYAIYNDVLLGTAIKRNEERANNGGRRVPDGIIEEKWRVQSFPLVEEGFKEVIILHNDLEVRSDLDDFDRSKLLAYIITNPRETIETWHESGELEELLPSLEQSWGIKQENINHTQLLHEHMIRAAELIEDKNSISVISMLLHDVGKSKTKEFFVKVIAENESGFKIGEKLVAVRDAVHSVLVKVKSYQNGYTESVTMIPASVVEKDYNAHFYDHEKVGAVMARRDLIRLGFDEKFADEVYAYILYHMELPFRLGSNKSMRKLINKVTPKRIPILMSIRQADKLSSNTKKDFAEQHEEMQKQIDEILKLKPKGD